MIYWFIGQPGCGKTTLAKKLKFHLEKTGYPIHLDGDDLRRIFGDSYTPESFTEEYRNDNTRKLQRLVEHIHEQGYDVVVSTVNSVRSVREELKQRNPDVIEIYVTNSGKHVRQEYHRNDFEVPLEKYISIDTNGLTPEDAFDILQAEL